MKTYVFISILLLIVTTRLVQAQEIADPYTARAYWLEENNPAYLHIITKKDRGDSLSVNELEWLKEYMIYLDNYYARLSPEEKLKYRENKPAWDREYAVNTASEEASDILETKAKGVKPGKKYSLYNGLYGFGYGLASIFIFGLDETGGSGIIAIPFFTAGAALLYPLINKKRYEDLTYPGVMLTRHGKFAGAIHGGALGLAIFGNDIDHPAQILVPMVVGSISLGEVGFQLGKKKNWTEGQVATYQYYGLLGPFVGVSSLIAAGVETNAHLYGAIIPISGLIGYKVGDKINNRYHFTRGDMLATSTFGILSAGAGFGMIPYENTDEWMILIPLSTTIGGTALVHSILKDKQLSARQGWNIQYASGAGILIGIGIGALIQSESANVNILLPTAGGLLGWFAGLKYQLKNQEDEARLGQRHKPSFSFNLMPENYFMNKQFYNTAGTRAMHSLPVANLSLTF